jgi:predicted transglutaminase-like cysteine proteinase
MGSFLDLAENGLLPTFMTLTGLRPELAIPSYMRMDTKLFFANFLDFRMSSATLAAAPAGVMVAAAVTGTTTVSAASGDAAAPDAASAELAIAGRASAALAEGSTEGIQAICQVVCTHPCQTHTDITGQGTWILHSDTDTDTEIYTYPQAHTQT